MTVQTQSNKIIVLGDGITTQFAFDNFVGVASAYISVIFTDASGNETVLTQGSGATQYQISLNAPVTGAIWGVGGTVTYAPSGTPIAAGTTLTIFRTLPLTQAISLQNQISLSALGSGAETGLDTIEMQLQQVAETTNRVITAPIVDPSTINLVMPPAAQRANTGLAFDSQGNVIAGTTPATGLISTAMQPVVDAASLALGRAAFGLGNIATQNIGSGLQADGAGNVRVNSPTVQVATSQVVDATFDLNRYIATGPINFSLNRANTLWNGFGFWLEAIVGDITLFPDSHDTISGASGSGVAATIPAGAKVFITTDGATNATWYVEGLPYLVTPARNISGNYPIQTSDNAKVLSFNDGTVQVIGFPSAGTLQTDFRCLIVNSETGLVGKRVAGLGADFIMYPGQAYMVERAGSALVILGGLQRWRLMQATTFYVDQSAGGAFNDGLAPGPTRAFASPQIGIDAICNNLDANRQNIVLQFKDDTYTIPIHLYPVTGWGTIGGHSELIIQGNMATPANCLISVANSNCISMVGLTTPWRCQGFRLQVTSGVGNCISVDGSSFFYIGASMEFGTAPNAHISVSYKSFVEAVGGSYSIVGGAGNHVNANVSSLADMVGTNITLIGNPNFSNAFAFASELADVTFQLCTFTGTAAGSRYSVVLNAVINTGTGNLNFLPGTSPGASASGGQYA
jgi:hypothetical protein